MPAAVSSCYMAVAAIAEDDADGAQRALGMSRWTSGPLTSAEAGMPIVSLLVHAGSMQHHIRVSWDDSPQR